MSFDQPFIRMPPEYHTDPPGIMEMVSKLDLVSVHIARLRTLEVQLNSELELVRQRIEILEHTARKVK